ncbi:tyrosine-type recombinase/integrase [Wenjunlia tyrosinilytica]|uniref:Tyrosine recombinase XerC n=1 Tax=Wenjunlia tyrosinilytica TaxID=1544741 RepID=A0A917ZQ28_9ACTN|nr:site-specific integrase [Wenjunlia tyrosinilytica]GGO89264.1 tyrosine recombinase XerC [Wenjunlia tyrosinilytica]
MAARKTHKNPLRTRTVARRGELPADASVLALSTEVETDADYRAQVLAEWVMYLQTTTNRRGRPYQGRTIDAYRFAVVALDRWMSEQGIAGDFTACDAQLLNRFFRWYYAKHDLPKSLDGRGGYTGGTNTQQRNLRLFFVWLEQEYDHPNPYLHASFQRFAAPELGKPRTLSQDFVRDVLAATGGGSPRVRDFESVRDHAMIRVLTEGLRAEELLNLQVDDLHLSEGVLIVVPLKGGRNSKDGRVIPIQPRTVAALHRYLRLRTKHNKHAEPWLWLGARSHRPMQYMGVYRMVKRRTEEAGHDPALVTPHSFCHTWTDDLLSAGVSGEDVMAIRGWKSHRMLLRYGADQASSRAVKSVSVFSAAAPGRGWLR